MYVMICLFGVAILCSHALNRASGSFRVLGVNLFPVFHTFMYLSMHQFKFFAATYFWFISFNGIKYKVII